VIRSAHADKLHRTAPPPDLPQQIVDRLGWFNEPGVTMSAVPIPPVSGIEAYLDHAQWVIEEIAPRIA
jgi:hypothetical protein